MFDTTLGVGADERREPTDEQLPEITFTLLLTELLSDKHILSKGHHNRQTLDKEDFSEMPSLVDCVLMSQGQWTGRCYPLTLPSYLEISHVFTRNVA